jgi:hypothetical protein
MSNNHGDQTAPDGIHIVYAFVYANSAQRLADVRSPTDKGKVALQNSDNSFWILNSSPNNWTQLDTAGGGATLIPITTVITANVADLSAAPSSNDGYVLLASDVLSLSNQTNPANNRLYTSNGAGLLTPLSTQPPDGTLLRTTKGANGANVLWIYETGSVSLSNSNSGTIVGTYTTVTFAPDALGLSNVENEGVGRISIAGDAAFHDVWTFDMVGRGKTVGRLKVFADCLAVDGPKISNLILRTVVALSATPTAGVVSTSSLVDRIEEAGGPYGDIRFTIVGTVLKLQIKNNQASPVQYCGVVSFGVVIP